MVKQYGLLGESLPHTMSPPIHKELFKISGIKGDYNLFEYTKNEFVNSIDKLMALDGFNITIPYKQEIMKYLDELDISAQIHQSVNVVKNENGKHIGYNTDCIGFRKVLQDNNVDISKKVIVIGIGGVGKMFATECAINGADVTLGILERHKKQASDIIAHIKTIYPKANLKTVLTSDIKEHYDLLINATPVGMFPHIDVSPVENSIIKNIDCIFDCIYNPTKTLILQYAKEYGKKAIGGMNMLIYQAVGAQEIWNVVHFDYETQLKKVINKFSNIQL